MMGACWSERSWSQPDAVRASAVPKQLQPLGDRRIVDHAVDAARADLRHRRARRPAGRRLVGRPACAR